jgi:hypothetical protein
VFHETAFTDQFNRSINHDGKCIAKIEDQHTPGRILEHSIANPEVRRTGME